MSQPHTLYDLKNSPWNGASRTVREELRANLLHALDAGTPLFEGVIGYEDTVLPQIINAILAHHDFILLGLRGQAKTRILRGLVELLDPAIPVIAGSEVNDDPFRPISKFGRDLVTQCGDATPIAWLKREDRYVEKLATPDVTIADMIGDLDPIKAARGGHLLSDELSMHYGLLPRANRGIFAINELPDLSGKIQVGLFNIMQEGDVQIKGYPVRLPLDVLMCFTANPEDYTARGKIITPLKDRIGSEILHPLSADRRTGHGHHAPGGVDRAGRQAGRPAGLCPRGNRARRLRGPAGQASRPAERRKPAPPDQCPRACRFQRGAQGPVHKEATVTPRITDIYSALPSITGKLELEYEGELQGADAIARELIRRAAGATMMERLGHLDLASIVAWFDAGGALKIAGDEKSDTCLKGFSVVPGLVNAVVAGELAGRNETAKVVAACELILEGLAAQKKIARSDELGYSRIRPERNKEGGYGKGGINFG